MISGPSGWSARVFFGHLYKSVHLIDGRHVATVYTSPVVPCLSSANVFPLDVNIASTNSLLLKRECTTENACRLGKWSVRYDGMRGRWSRKSERKQMKLIKQKKNKKNNAGKKYFDLIDICLCCVHNSTLISSSATVSGSSLQDLNLYIPSFDHCFILTHKILIIIHVISQPGEASIQTIKATNPQNKNCEIKGCRKWEKPCLNYSFRSNCGKENAQGLSWG